MPPAAVAEIRDADNLIIPDEVIVQLTSALTKSIDMIAYLLATNIGKSEVIDFSLKTFLPVLVEAVSKSSINHRFLLSLSPEGAGKIVAGMGDQHKADVVQKWGDGGWKMLLALPSLSAKARRALSPPPTGDTIARSETVSNLYARLKEVKFIQVRGTPASGKSTLASLLYHYIKREDDRKVHWIVGWPDQDVRQGVGEFLVQAKGWNWNDNSVVIIDEAQATFSDHAIWDGIFKELALHPSRQNCIIIFTSHGSPVSSDAGRTPWNAPSHNKIGLRADSSIFNGVGIGLFFSRDEFEEYRSQRVEKFNTDFFNWLFELTAGHIGALEETLGVLRADTTYRRLGHLEKYTHANFIRDLDPDVFYKGLATGSIFSRGLPKIEHLRQPGIASVLRDVIVQGSIATPSTSPDFTDESLERCYRDGWLHAISKGAEGTEFIFASPLHECFVCWNLFPDDASHGPDFSDILEFCSEIISGFSASTLLDTWSVGAGHIQRTPEAHYQHEFYRCSRSLARGRLKVFPEYGTAKGRADFYFPSKNWAVELLRDGKRLKEHVSRFAPSGKYTQTLTINEHILLDFRTSRPVMKHDYPNLYHVVITTDLDTQTLSRFEILDTDLKVMRDGVLTRGS